MTQPINYQPDNAEAGHEKRGACAVHETFFDRQAVISQALSRLVESVNNSAGLPEPVNESPVQMSQDELARQIDGATVKKPAPVHSQPAPSGRYPINLEEARRQTEMVHDKILAEGKHK